MSHKPEVARALLKRADQIKADQANFDALYEDVATFVVPNRAGFITKRTVGERLTAQELCDSTAVIAAPTLASAIHGALTNSALQWFHLRYRDPDLNLDDAAREWLETCVARMHKALSQSPWDMSAQEGYLDLVSFGSAGVDIGERRTIVGGWGGLFVECWHPSTYVFEEDEERDVVCLYRWKEFSKRQALKLWPDTISEKVRRDADKRPDFRHKFLEVIEPRGDIRQLYHRAPATQRPWASTWVDVEGKSVVEETGYHEFPMALPRWFTASGETRGRGPGLNSMPDIRTLNRAKELGLRAWAKVLDPPLKRRNKGVIGRIRTSPGGITDVRDADAVAPLYDSNAFRFDVSELKHSDLKMAIEKAFFIDQLHLPPVSESKTMSATEIEVRYEQMQKILGPTMGRIKTEFLAPAIRRVFGLMFRANQFPPPPMALDNDRGGLDIEYVSPFERAQKSGELAAVQRTLGAIAEAAQIVPEAIDNVDPDGVVAVIKDALSPPNRMFRKQSAVEELREQRAEAQEAAEAMAAAQGMSEVSKNMGGEV